MIEEYGIETKLGVDELVTVVRLYYEDASDAEIARELGDDSLDKTVRRARISLHLLDDSDLDGPFEIEELEYLLDEGATTTECAEKLGVSSSTVRSYRDTVKARRRSEEADEKYVGRFEEVIQDRDISENFTDDAKKDGLEGATEDAEVDVDL